MTENEISKEYTIEAPKHRKYYLKRGGWFGLTIETREEPETANEGLLMVATGLLVAVIGQFILGTAVGTAVAAFALFTAGVGFERFRYMRSAKEDNEEA